MNHPITGFDYGCGSAYFNAAPERQRDARRDYWHDLKARLDADTGGIRSRHFSNAADHYADARAGLLETAPSL